jgi:hypothetical protein
MSLPYSLKPINELMDELNALGGSSQVRMLGYTLLAITNGVDYINTYTAEHEEELVKEFLTLKGYRKKYYYDQIHKCVSAAVVSEPLVQFYSGFNVNILLVGLQTLDILKLLPECDSIAISHTAYVLTNDKAVDMITGVVLPPRS